MAIVSEELKVNENDVVEGVWNYLKDKHSSRDGFKSLIRADATRGDHGIDLKCVAYSGKLVSNRYYIEAKGTLKAKDNSPKKSDFRVEFRWAISQIVLRMKEWSTATNYGIAIPATEKEPCLKIMRDSKGLNLLKVRLFLAFRTDNGDLYAEEMTPDKIYPKRKKP